MSEPDLIRVNVFMPAKLVTAAKTYGTKRGITLTELMRTALKTHMVTLLKEEAKLPEELRDV